MSFVRVTREELERRGACEEGIALFDAIAPSGRWEGEWTPLHAVWLAVAYNSFALWCMNREIIPKGDLRGADLRGANLRGVYLRGLDLREADFRGADLSGVDFRGVDLRGTNLRDADLGGADLRFADFSGADLYGADLQEADLRYTNLDGANLKWAYLGWAARLVSDLPIPGWNVVDDQLVRA